jgi:hypothetical protein
MEKAIPAIAAAFGVFKRARVIAFFDIGFPAKGPLSAAQSGDITSAAQVKRLLCP